MCFNASHWIFTTYSSPKRQNQGATGCFPLFQRIVGTLIANLGGISHKRPKRSRGQNVICLAKGTSPKRGVFTHVHTHKRPKGAFSRDGQGAPAQKSTGKEGRGSLNIPSLPLKRWQNVKCFANPKEGAKRQLSQLTFLRGGKMSTVYYIFCSKKAKSGYNWLFSIISENSRYLN